MKGIDLSNLKKGPDHSPDHRIAFDAWQEAKVREAEAKKQLQEAQDHYRNCYDDARAAWVALQEVS